MRHKAPALHIVYKVVNTWFNPGAVLLPPVGQCVNISAPQKSLKLNISLLTFIRQEYKSELPVIKSLIWKSTWSEGTDKGSRMVFQSLILHELHLRSRFFLRTQMRFHDPLAATVDSVVSALNVKHRCVSRSLKH